MTQAETKRLAARSGKLEEFRKALGGTRHALADDEIFAMSATAASNARARFRLLSGLGGARDACRLREYRVLDTEQLEAAVTMLLRRWLRSAEARFEIVTHN